MLSIGSTGIFPKTQICMSMRRTIVKLWLVLVAGFGVAACSGEGDEPEYQFAEVSRSDLQATVSSTGTIQAVGTVAVGTQVSGTVDAVYADFNSQVTQGQLLARLDTRVLASAIEDAKSNVARAQAQYDVARDEYNRRQPLFKKGYLSASEFSQFESNLAVAKASLNSARIALSRAETNLGYAEIRSPITGTVIQRAVETGMTVAASFSTPTLFTIAKDLSTMEIHAAVDESDIGQIKVAQRVTFTVQSAPNKTFEGRVREIRMLPQTVQNVVNYTVVIDTRNENGVLLPGMTATVEFMVAEANDVLVVPNAALRFQPPPAVLEKMRAERAARGGDTARSSQRTGGARGSNDTTSRSGSAGRQGAGGRSTRLWMLGADGVLSSVPVTTGLSDGQRTEVSGKGITEGTKVITGAVVPGAAPAGRSTLPIGGGAGGGGRRGGF